MAIMHPVRLTDRVLNDKKLRGERETYRALATLPDEYEVFYDRCANPAQGSKAYKRRIDFIVLHEKFGMLAIEVKGGKIRLGQDGSIEQYHPRDKKWTAIDPYAQVERAMRELISICKADGAQYWIPDDTCVIFPNTSRRIFTESSQKLPGVTLCEDDLGLLPTLMPTLFSKSRRDTAWPRDAFLDMRRRLQNMPEGDNGDQRAKPYEHPKAVQQTNIDKTPSSVIDARSFAEKFPFKPHDDRESFSTAARKVYSAAGAGVVPARLKWWQIIIGICIGSGAALIFAMFLKDFNRS